MKFTKVLFFGGFLVVTWFSGAPVAHALVRSITFPVNGTYSFRDDFSEPRGGGTRTHLGIDIISAKMTPVVAAVDGKITFIAIPEASWGYSISIQDSDGYSYRYLHINNDTPGTDDGQGGITYAYAPGLKRGSVVTKGQLIGWVGDSGNAEDTVSHLHFEIWNPQRTAVDPYESLLAVSGNSNAGQSNVIVQHTADGGIAEEEQFIATRSLQEGLVDAQVATLHQQLKTLGLYSGAITETYNAVTREAVRSFQVAQGIPASGISDGLTQRRLLELVKNTPQPVAPPTLDLELGAQGESVRTLQINLKELGFFTADTTAYFGPITRDALVAFQKANSIIPASGYYGPVTRAVFASGKAVSASAGTTASVTPSADVGVKPLSAFSRDLELGSQGEDVRELQKYLNTNGYPVAQTGIGSLGNETTYFGSLTQKALTVFQKANNISPSAGYFGSITRSHL